MKKTHPLVCAALILIAVGCLLRLAQYATRESFWKDETGLAVNFFDRTLANIHEPFANIQAAPIGFLQVSKIAEMTFGHNEKALWLLPLVASLAALVVAAAAWRKELRGLPWVLALGALSLDGTLLTHTTQFKPYALDVLTTLIICWAFFYERRTGKWLPYLAAGLFGLWMSYTSVFVLAGLGLWQLATAARQKGEYLRTLFANAALGAVFLVLYFGNYILLDEGGGFHRFWADNFVPGGLAFFDFVADELGKVIGYLFGQRQWLWLVIFTVLGAIRAWHIKRYLLALLLPILLTLIASMLRLYPVYDRLVLFWVPLLIPFLALGLGWLWEALHEQRRTLAVAFIFCVALPYAYPLRAIGNGDPQQLKQVTLEVVKQAHKGDIIYMHPRSVHLYNYYFHRYPPQAGVQVIDGSKDDPLELYKLIKERYAGKRVFFIYTEPCYAIDEIQVFGTQALRQKEVVSFREYRVAGFLELRVRGLAE